MIRLSYFNTFLFSLQLISILGAELFRSQSRYESTVKPLPDWLDGVLTSIMAAEVPALRYMSLPFGGSILCVAAAVDEWFWTCAIRLFGHRCKTGCGGSMVLTPG